MSTSKYVQCNCCGLWFVEFDTQRVQSGRRVSHYCRECTYKLLKLKQNNLYGGLANESFQEKHK